jgi:hypothetical protein
MRLYMSERDGYKTKRRKECVSERFMCLLMKDNKYMYHATENLNTYQAVYSLILYVVCVCCMLGMKTKTEM